MVQIVPAILAQTEEEYKSQLEKIENSKASETGWVHIDLMDNKFVPNQSVGLEVIKNNLPKLNIETHLMVSDPTEFLTDLKEAGIKRVIAHIESENIDEFLNFCEKEGLEIGLAIKIDTSLEEIEPYWERIDLVLIMSIEPGFQGQPLNPKAFRRIAQVAEICKKLEKPIFLGVDGHINDRDANAIVAAGADHLVVGSFLLEGDIDENLEKIKKSLNS